MKQQCGMHWINYENEYVLTCSILTSDLKFNTQISNIIRAKSNSILKLLCRNLKISSHAVKAQVHQSLVHLTWSMLPRFGAHILPITSKKWKWCRDVLQDMCAITGTIPAVLVRFLATSVGSPSLFTCRNYKRLHFVGKQAVLSPWATI